MCSQGCRHRYCSMHESASVDRAGMVSRWVLNFWFLDSLAAAIVCRSGLGCRAFRWHAFILRNCHSRGSMPLAVSPAPVSLGSSVSLHWYLPCWWCYEDSKRQPWLSACDDVYSLNPTLSFSLSHTHTHTHTHTSLWEEGVYVLVVYLSNDSAPWTAPVILNIDLGGVSFSHAHFYQYSNKLP